jgi:hypothetical protein
MVARREKNGTNGNNGINGKEIKAKKELLNSN